MSEENKKMTKKYQKISAKQKNEHKKFLSFFFTQYENE